MEKTVLETVESDAIEVKTSKIYLFIKRVTDITGSLAGLILLSPLLIIVGILIKIESKGPIIFSQNRIGMDGRVFKMYKLRSMVANAEELKEKLMEENEMSGPMFKIKDDPRITKVGRFIRKTSIDELPQLFNVLRGDMSLVGPRPERPQFVEKFKEEIPRYMIKHQVRPGLTGWAQVNGYRGDTSIKKRIEHDLYYIENWTLGFDFKIIFLTFFKGFINKNAY